MGADVKTRVKYFRGQPRNRGKISGVKRGFEKFPGWNPGKISGVDFRAEGAAKIFLGGCPPKARRKNPPRNFFPGFHPGVIIRGDH